MKKRITRSDWNYIGKYNHAAKWIRPFCSYFLAETEKGFRREVKISWPCYLLLFIPVHLLQALLCMWDGGLKEFDFQGRSLGFDNINEIQGANQSTYSRAREVWERV